jgi:hypothetical protein
MTADDKLVIATIVFDPADDLRSFELIAVLASA